MKNKLALQESVWFFGIAHLLARVLLYWLSKNQVNSARDTKLLELP